MASEAQYRSRPATSGLRRWLAVAVAMAVGGAVAAPYVRDVLADKLADYWQTQLLEASDSQAPYVARRVARLGPPGMGMLVAALASPQAGVADAARRTLLEETASWTAAPLDETATSAVVLAEALARTIARLGPAARLLASDLSQRLLARPFDADAARQNRLTTACEAVLRATSDERRVVESPTRGADTAASGGDEELGGEAANLDRVDDLPGVGLLPTTADDTQRSRQRTASHTTGRRRQDNSSLRWQAGLASSDPDESAADEISVDDKVTQPLEPQPSAEPAALAPAGVAAVEAGAPLRVAPLEISSPTAAPAPDAATDSPADDMPALMRRLHEPKPDLAQAAVDELRRRGFGVEQLNLARRLAHPDAQRRLAFARGLAQPVGFDRRPWLYWLLDDSDADVRWEAFSLLATTGDPQVLQELEQRARNDADARIRGEIERLQKQRTAGSGGPRR